VSVRCDVSGFFMKVVFLSCCVAGELVRMDPVSCDTFVVLPPLTAHGGVIFGKNSDRPKGEVQELIYQPAQQYTPGEQLQVNTANCLPSSQLEKVKVYGLLLKNVFLHFRNFAAKLENQYSTCQMEVVTVMFTDIEAFCDMTECRFVNSYKRLGGTFCTDHQSSRFDN